jgi:hypothetical protein
MRKAAFLFLSFIFLFSVSASNIGVQSYTVQQANLSVSNATAYINNINQSGYLIFKPDLTQAYAYLSAAQASYLTQPTFAVSQAGLAESSALAAYNKISSYKSTAALIMIILTIITAMVLYKLSLPDRKH